MGQRRSSNLEVIGNMVEGFVTDQWAKRGAEGETLRCWQVGMISLMGYDGYR